MRRNRRKPCCLISAAEASSSAPSACSVAARHRPRAAARTHHRQRASRPQPPLIVIPGAFGSRLFDTRSGEEIWPRFLGAAAVQPLHRARGRDRRVDPGPARRAWCFAGRIPPRDWGGISTARFSTPWRRSDVTSGASRVSRSRRAGATTTSTCTTGDWTTSLPVNGLHELIERIRHDYGDPRLQVDLLAHSNGGLLARYYARFGAVDHSMPRLRYRLRRGAGDPPSAHGRYAEPRQHAARAVTRPRRGNRLEKDSAEVVATTSGAPQLMPHLALPWLICAQWQGHHRGYF